MKRWAMAAGMVCVLGMAGAYAAEGAGGAAAATGEMTQKTCPVMKEAIDSKVYLDYHGYRLYFCCTKCQKKAKDDPAKYLRALVAMGQKPQMLGKPQTTCPMTGEKISGKNFGVVGGLRVDFCCGDCEKKFDAMSEADKLKVVDKLVAGGQVPTLLSKDQASCPVMGGKINKAVYVDVGGERTYFCCPGCKAKYVADKATYDKQLAADGVALERAPVM